MADTTYATYIMANSRPTLYVGMTNNLIKRVHQHRTETDKDSFTARYHLHKLVYFELTTSPLSAIIREKQIKNMSRSAKLELIRGINPDFRDLFPDIIEAAG